MARTKQTARKSTGGKAPRKQLASSSCRWPVCYDLGYGERHKPISINKRHSQLPKSHSQDTASLKLITNFKRPKDFPQFVKLPCEIQNMVWEMVAEEPRVVAVNSRTNKGLYSTIPPILHVSSESRAVGLKHYTLAFQSKSFAPTVTDNPESKANLPQPGVYFNFERDTLYLRDNWNAKVAGPWCCLSRFYTLVNEADLTKVKRVGLDVNTRVCSLKTCSVRCHSPNFAFWDALEIMYIGYETVKLGTDCSIALGELEGKDYKDFLERYRMNPCWRYVDGALPDGEAVEHLENGAPIAYYGSWNKPESFLQKLELVSVKHL